MLVIKANRSKTAGKRTGDDEHGPERPERFTAFLPQIAESSPRQNVTDLK